MIINFSNIGGGGSSKDYVKTEDFLTSEEVISRALNELHETGGSGSGGTQYRAGKNIDITNNTISVTGITVPTNTSDLLNDSGFITDADLNGYATENWVEGKGYLTQHQSLSAYSTTVQVQSMIDGVEAQIPTKVSELDNDSGYLTEHQSLSGLFASVNYVSSAKTIYFYDKSNTQVGSIDTTDFIKDGMVENVYISGDTLYISFNTDSGKETIEIALTDVFNPNNYYTKTEVNNLFANESARTENTYTTSAQVQSMIDVLETEIPTKVSELTNDSKFIPSTSDSDITVTGIRVLTQAAYDNLVATSAIVNTIIYIIKD